MRISGSVLNGARGGQRQGSRAGLLESSRVRAGGFGIFKSLELRADFAQLLQERVAHYEEEGKTLTLEEAFAPFEDD